ncbi:hypothetical protein EBM89_18825, partial [Cellulomonas triticagri]
MTVPALVPHGTLGSVRVLLPVEVPVVPDAEEARRWLENELADPVYHQRPSLLSQLWAWLQRLFEGADGVPLGNVGTLLAVLGLLVALVGIAFLVTGPVRRSRRVTGTGAVLDDDDRRSAADLRAAADAAAAREAWAAAVADRFR